MASGQEPTAPEPPASAPEVGLVTSSAGQVLALSVNDRGQISLAVTERAFGRGTVSPAGDPAWEEEDRTLTSVSERIAALQRWSKTGRLDKLRALQPGAAAEGNTGDFLTRVSESIATLTPAGKGSAETQLVTIAGGFRDPADGPGSAVLALPDGRWLYGCPPAIWRLEDTSGDGQTSRREAILTGLGVRCGSYTGGLHALLEGADGWIYCGVGDRGWNFTDSEGTVQRGLREGAILRFRPDGQDPEVFARGLVNPTGLAMDALGNLFAVDAAPPGGKTRVLHVTEGADYGWRDPGSALETSTWQLEGMSARLASLPDPDAPQWAASPIALVDEAASALVADPGSGTPETWRGWFIAADVRPDGSGGLRGWEFRPAGSTFTLADTRALWTGGAVTDAAFSPDGTLYFTNWGDKVDARSACTIQSLTWPQAAAPDSQEDPAAVLAAGLRDLPVKTLKTLLESPSARLRLRAEQTLAALTFQESLESLLHVARRSTVLEARLHGLWGAAILARQDRALLNELTMFLNDPEPRIRMTAVRLLGESGHAGTARVLLQSLRDPETSVRREGALALARLRPPGILPDLLAAIAVENDNDPLTRNALARALAACAPSATLTATAADNPLRPVRMATVLALRLQEDESVTAFLADPDTVIATEAARAIWDLPLFPALPALAAAILPGDDTAPPRTAAFVRRALAAALHCGTADDAGNVAAFAAADRDDIPEALRLAAMDTLGMWDNPPAVDPLTGRPSLFIPRLPGTARTAIRTRLSTLAKSGKSALATRAAALLAGPGRQASPDSLTKSVLDPAVPEPQRVDAFLQLATRAGGASLLATCQTLLESATTPALLRAESRAWQVKRDPKNAIAHVSDALIRGTAAERQRAVATLDHMVGREFDRCMLDLGNRLSSGSVDPVVTVEVIESVMRHDNESRSPWQRAWESYLAAVPMDRDPLALWRPAQNPGDPVKGQEIFQFHPLARCATCHSLRGQGGTTGPVLDGVGARLSSSGLLAALVHPSDSCAPPYYALTVSLKDGRTLHGRTLEKTAATLRLATAGGPVTLTPSEIADFGEPVSTMPPMGTLLTLRELRDLLAWLETME